MKVGFSTLGCPSWSLDTICRRAAEYGFEGVDFRGMGEEIDVATTPEFTNDLPRTRRRFADAGVAICGISSSLKICEGDMLDANLEEARRTIPIALELNVDTIRVFGGGDAVRTDRSSLANIGQETMQAVLSLDGARKLKWIFESHDSWVAASDCRLLLDRIEDRAFGVLWDVGHTSRVGGESHEVSMKALEDRIYGVHLKDAIHDTTHPHAMADGWRYVPPGSGQLPITEALAGLHSAGYGGWVLFEHEKRWHEELADPEDIFPVFMEWYRQQMLSLGTPLSEQ